MVLLYHKLSAVDLGQLPAPWCGRAVPARHCRAGRCLLPAGGTRFIGVYLARQLIDAGHEVTLLTRGKKPVTYRIPDDTGAGRRLRFHAATRCLAAALLPGCLEHSTGRALLSSASSPLCCLLHMFNPGVYRPGVLPSWHQG